MSKKSVKNDKGEAGVRPARAGAAGGAAAGAAAAAGEVSPGEPWPMPCPLPKVEMHDALFELYVARVATIDRYRVPITDRGLPATYRKAFDEAVVALEVYQEMASARNAAGVAQ